MYFPVLSHFVNGNPWSASLGRLRFRVRPTVDDTGTEGVLTCEVWEGPWAYEFSEVEETKTFPLTQQGLDALPRYLIQWAEQMEARPKRTFEENIARRKEQA